jgi:hypothetical protein
VFGGKYAMVDKWSSSVNEYSYDEWTAKDAFVNEVSYRGMPQFCDNTAGGYAYWDKNKISQDSIVLAVTIRDKFNCIDWPFTCIAYIQYDYDVSMIDDFDELFHDYFGGLVNALEYKHNVLTVRGMLNTQVQVIAYEVIRCIYQKLKPESIDAFTQNINRLIQYYRKNPLYLFASEKKINKLIFDL